jgi:hypothetical protein
MFRSRSLTVGNSAIKNCFAKCGFQLHDVCSNNDNTVTHNEDEYDWQFATYWSAV